MYTNQCMVEDLFLEIPLQKNIEVFTKKKEQIDLNPCIQKLLLFFLLQEDTVYCTQ